MSLFAQPKLDAGSDMFGESGANANVWVAASDGDLKRVKELVEVKCHLIVKMTIK